MVSISVGMKFYICWCHTKKKLLFLWKSFLNTGCHVAAPIQIHHLNCSHLPPSICSVEMLQTVKVAYFLLMLSGPKCSTQETSVTSKWQMWLLKVSACIWRCNNGREVFVMFVLAVVLKICLLEVWILQVWQPLRKIYFGKELNG